MEIYLVGGAVRDTLLGLPVKDRDWVVVGGTPQQLLAQGYTPVGRDFPVFLHPRTHEQVALARTERKTAPGYQGFAIHAAPDVTLEQDLARRDLTINAIAVPQAHTDAAGNFDPQRATLIDPYGGRADLAARQLHHVTDAFREDPVRILRVARFAARFADFSVAPDTRALMQAMVTQGEAAALVAERVWQELVRGLMEVRPSRMLQVLQACGAYKVVLPELVAASPGPQGPLLQTLDRCAELQAPLTVRFACLCLHADSLAASAVPRDGQPIHRMGERLRVPSDCIALADLLCRERSALQTCDGTDAQQVLQLLERCDAIRKPERMAEFLLAIVCAADDAQRASAAEARDRTLMALAAARAVQTASIAERAQAEGLRGPAIGRRVREARLLAVMQGLQASSRPANDNGGPQAAA